MEMTKNGNGTNNARSHILFDLWGTLGRGPDPEPIFTFKDDILKLSGKVDDEEFLRTCLSTSVADSDPANQVRDYLYKIADHFQLQSIPVGAVEKLENLIRIERNGLSIFADVNDGLIAVMDWGFEVGMCTNSWEHPIETLLNSTGLDQVFKPNHVIVSATESCAKQEGARLYHIAAAAFGLDPSRFYMVGDDPNLDIFPAHEAGMRPILIDRKEKHLGADGSFKTPEMHRMAELEIPVIRNLTELLTTLLEDMRREES